MQDSDWSIPAEIEAKDPGRWIAWDTNTERVISVGDTLDEIVVAATPDREQKHLIWYHHVLAPGTVLVGGLW